MHDSLCLNFSGMFCISICLPLFETYNKGGAFISDQMCYFMLHNCKLDSEFFQ